MESIHNHGERWQLHQTQNITSKPQRAVLSHPHWAVDDWPQVTHPAAHSCGLLIVKSELVVNPALNLLTRPKAIAIERNKGELVIEWSDQHSSAFPLRWLRANCPCATCREERRSAALESDILKLSSGPLPSMQIADATLVGNYAIRLVWTDGHDAGIYAFSLLRAGCPCASCHPNGPPKFLLEG